MNWDAQLNNIYIPGNVALFCGAGISYNSGIPLVRPLMVDIMRSLEIDEADMELYLARAPFEAFVETLNHNLRVDNLLKVFDVKNPNDNHYLIANLLKLKIAKYTTNFDLNIEIAAANVGMKAGIDFELVRDPLLQKLIGENSTAIIKLHGSIDNPGSVWATLSRVATKKNSEIITPLLQLLFDDTSEHRFVIILGYSFSDKFDVQPLLEELIEKSNKIVININHSDQNGTLEAKFIGRSISQISIDTNYYTSRILEVLSIAHTWSLDESPVEWQTVVEEWIAERMDGQGVRNKYANASNLFDQVGMTDLAMKYAENGLKASETLDSKGLMDLWDKKANYLAKPDKGLAPLLEALKCSEQAIIHAKSVDAYSLNTMNTKYNFILSTIGDHYMNEGEFKLGQEYIEKSFKPLTEMLEYFKQTGDLERISGLTLNLALSYRRILNYDKALELNYEVLKTTSNIGDTRVKQNEAMAHYNIGVILETQKKWEAALLEYLSAFNISKQLGMAEREFFSFKKVIVSYAKLNQEANAHHFFDANYSNVRMEGNIPLRKEHYYAFLAAGFGSK